MIKIWERKRNEEEVIDIVAWNVTDTELRGEGRRVC
jgi:hypothetical protein